MSLCLITLVVARVTLRQSPGSEALPRIDDDLHKALADAKPADRIPIFVLLSRQNSLAEMKEFARSHSKSELRSQAITRMKQIARSEQGALLADLHQPSIHPSFDIEKSFWIVNGLQMKATPAVVSELAVSARVARIYLRAEKPDSILISSGRKSQVFPQHVSTSTQRPFLRPGVKIPWNLKRIGADRAWHELGITGKGVIVAIMDSGINYRHPDIRERLWVNRGEIANNNTDDDGNGYVDDYYGYNFANGNPNINDDFFHGTICGAIICGDGTSGVVTGVAPEAQLMVLRVYDQTVNYNLRYIWQFYQYDAWEGFQYAVENGAQVVNMSYDWQPPEKPLHAVWRNILENVTGSGIVLVAGAGNSRPSLPVPFQLTPPASIPDVISVAGTLEDDSILRLSSRGPVSWTSYPPFNDFPYPPGLRKPDVAAPVSVGDFPLLMFSGTGYVVDQQEAGTSTAAPHVSGLVALMLQQNPELLPWEIHSLLQESSRDLGASGWDPYFGFGLVNAVSSLRFNKLPRIRYQEPPCENEKPGSDGMMTLALRNEGADGRDIQLSLEAIYPKLIRQIPAQTASQWPSGSLLRFSFPLKSLTPYFTGTARFQLTVADKTEIYLRCTIRLEMGSADLALFDDDGGGEFETYYEGELNDLKIPYRYRSLRNLAPDADSLKGVKTLLWITGEENRETLNVEDMRTIETFLKDNGKLVLIGQHIAQELKGSSFLEKVLKAEYAGETDGPEKFMLPVASGPIEADVASDPWRIDQLKPLNGARERLGYQPPGRYTGFLAVGQPCNIVFASGGLEVVAAPYRKAFLKLLLSQ